MHTVYLSLGSNLGDREANLTQALEALEARGVHMIRRSSLWETEPQDEKRQPWFLNMVAQAETSLFPRQLLHEIQRIERAHGRRRVIPKGPRTIDIDVLLYGRFVVTTPELQIPHPRMTERRFVLAPLAELAPELKHPVTRATVGDMLAAVKDQKARRVKSASLRESSEANPSGSRA